MLSDCIKLTIFCSQLSFINWLQNHLLRCPFKYLTGIDCPGCGFQRSLIALLQGDIQQSFALYPPTIPLLLFFAYGVADKRWKLDNSKFVVKKAFFIIVGSMVLINYGIKIWELYQRYKLSV
ncbi:DUF2752 domain-containing protein [Mucilaginibacter sp. SP1R1]|uniref:DUF2752 domain-containing protein n=1 Tax=Mucilaginibacter sp. SP1R1 TaxID=2723091 RepID=UPI00160F3FE6|nr:DUF2752 domain-containing protein [Mucilaginibacter sp. SP1R1]MBB6151243.1 hypothetical protein [Mucilaginibacter sp. SP1R1]